MESAVTIEDERRAAEMVLNGTALDRAKIATKALVSLMQNPDDTKQVFLLGLAVNLRAFPQLLARICMDDGGGRLLREQPSIDTKHVDYDALRKLPDGTLGREYVRFIDANRLDPDLFQAPPGLPQIPAYLTQRIRQVHDIWHVLTGYTPDIPGELALQAFSYAQMNTPTSLLLSVLGSIRWSLRFDNVMRKSLDGYRRGKRAKFLPAVWLEEMWARPLADVRRELGIEAVTN